MTESGRSGTYKSVTFEMPAEGPIRSLKEAFDITDFIDPMGRTGTVTEEGAAWPARPSTSPSTSYIRETYPDDEVLQAYAAVIESNAAIWMAMTQLYKAGENAGDGLKRWKAEKSMDVNGVITTDLILSIIDKEGTLRARAK